MQKRTWVTFLLCVCKKSGEKGILVPGAKYLIFVVNEVLRSNQVNALVRSAYSFTLRTSQVLTSSWNIIFNLIRPLQATPEIINN